VEAPTFSPAIIKTSSFNSLNHASAVPIPAASRWHDRSPKELSNNHEQPMLILSASHSNIETTHFGGNQQLTD